MDDFERRVERYISLATGGVDEQAAERFVELLNAATRETGLACEPNVFDELQLGRPEHRGQWIWARGSDAGDDYHVIQYGRADTPGS